MNLYEKIINIYPSLTLNDFIPKIGTIMLQNDGDQDYIKSWDNENPQPTQQQLDEIN